MISSNLQFITNALNTYLQNRFALSEPVAVLSPLLQRDESMAENTGNKIVVSLLNLEGNTVLQNVPAIPLHNNPTPSPNFNIVFLVAANYAPDFYVEALKYCDAVTDFFRDNPVFDKTAFPSLPVEVNMMQVVFLSLSLQDMQDLWRSLGVSYLPSMVYRVIAF